MNSVSLVGNLATEVELRQVGEKKVASFLLAVGRSGRDTGADFVWISAWERQAELCAEYLSKGNRIAVHGRNSGNPIALAIKTMDGTELIAAETRIK